MCRIVRYVIKVLYISRFYSAIVNHHAQMDLAMTAEIAVMNRSAIALAADSAVTITWGNSSKIYNGAEKLFALTKHHPVGIMVFGTGDLCRVSWELIVKQYRVFLGENSFGTLQEYADSFWGFISSQNELIPTNLKNASLKAMFEETFRALMSIVEQKFIQQHNSGVEITPEVTHEILGAEIEELRHLVEQADYLDGFSSEDLLGVKYLTDMLTDAVITDRFGDSPPFPQVLIDKLKNLFQLLSCKQFPIGVDTGLVIAGYGDLEYFPSVLCFSVKGFVNEKLRYSETKEKSMSAGACSLQAYAQDEEVLTFMQGINPSLLQFIDESYKKVLIKSHSQAESLIAELYEENPEGSSERLEDINRTMQTSWVEAQKSILGKIQNEFQFKVHQMIEFLPKEDLAYMAESLVNMTAFKRKVSNESESVGGPIDVAIISKGDGFIWVKRKHYFDKDLNHHYFKNHGVRGNG